MQHLALSVFEYPTDEFLNTPEFRQHDSVFTSTFAPVLGMMTPTERRIKNEEEVCHRSHFASDAPSPRRAWCIKMHHVEPCASDAPSRTWCIKMHQVEPCASDAPSRTLCIKMHQVEPGVSRCTKLTHCTPGGALCGAAAGELLDGAQHARDCAGGTCAGVHDLESD